MSKVQNVFHLVDDELGVCVCIYVSDAGFLFLTVIISKLIFYHFKCPNGNYERMHDFSEFRLSVASLILDSRVSCGLNKSKLKINSQMLKGTLKLEVWKIKTKTKPTISL